jgi:exosortase family protein XrtF
MKEQKDTIRFLAIAMLLYLVWYFIYDQWLHPDGRLDNWLAVQEAWLSGALLKLFGFAGSASGDMVKIDGYTVVRIGDPCNGMVLFALFGGFILAYPGLWRAKLYFIPLGMAAIFFLNILRIIALALNSYYFRQSLEFNHKYTFTFIVYAFIFAFWMIWIKRYGKQPQNYSATS